MTRDLDALSDTELIVHAREGNAPAYGVLWKRHWNAARAIAASITGRFEPDDLASEAFARILKAVEKGNGPRSGFRSYLAITIRNVAIDWSRRKTTPNIEDPDTIEDWTYSELTALKSIDRQTIARAFYALPDSWQEVLWYTEVEDMTPRDVAPLLGLTPNAVSALAARAREGLRQAWISAHLAESNSSDPVHGWTLKKLGPFVRGKLSQAERRKVTEHLANCPACSDAAEEADNVGYRLALGILPVILGIAGAAAYSAVTSSSGGAAVAAALPGATTPPGPAAGVRLAARLGHLFRAGAAGSNIGMGAVATTVAAAAALTAGAVMTPPPGQADALTSNSGSTSSSDGHRSAASSKPSPRPAGPDSTPAPGMLPAAEEPRQSAAEELPPSAEGTRAAGAVRAPEGIPAGGGPAADQPTGDESTGSGPADGPKESVPVPSPVGCEAAVRSVPAEDTVLAYALDDPSGSTVAADVVHGGSAQYDGVPGDPTWSLTDRVYRPATDVFTIQIWFRTAVGGGRLLGFSSSGEGLSAYHDRQLFLADDGRLVFGVFPDTVRTIESAQSYTDDRWHQATATLSEDGMALYVDGELVAHDPTVTRGQDFEGYWRIGYDNLDAWGPSTPSDYQFAGTLTYAAAYSTALSEGQIRSQWELCGGGAS